MPFAQGSRALIQNGGKQRGFHAPGHDAPPRAAHLNFRSNAIRRPNSPLLQSRAAGHAIGQWLATVRGLGAVLGLAVATGLNIFDGARGYENREFGILRNGDNFHARPRFSF